MGSKSTEISFTHFGLIDSSHTLVEIGPVGCWSSSTDTLRKGKLVTQAVVSVGGCCRSLTLVWIKHIDVLSEFGAVVAPSLPQAAQQTQPACAVPQHAPVGALRRHHG